MKLPLKLNEKLDQRRESDGLRSLSTSSSCMDFYSNDYLGMAGSEQIFESTYEFLKQHGYATNGSTGSRLLSGNHPLFDEIESDLSTRHKVDAALLFNSGYDANLSLLSCLPQKSDVILYDKLSHASIRDGIRLSTAKSFAFQHNDLEDLEAKLIKHSERSESEIYVVSESVFSMDGDSPELIRLCGLCNKYSALLIIDEAHALGVFGYGLIQELGLQEHCFARVVTFGKALGCHGAAVLGSESLKSYLINFARPFIYTTAMSPFSLASIHCSYKALFKNFMKLNDVIQHFLSEIENQNLKQHFISSQSAIQSCVIPGNKNVKYIAKILNDNDFAVKAILSPTVPQGGERIRICLHSYNKKQHLSSLVKTLAEAIKTL